MSDKKERITEIIEQASAKIHNECYEPYIILWKDKLGWKICGHATSDEMGIVYALLLLQIQQKAAVSVSLNELSETILTIAKRIKGEKNV